MPEITAAAVKALRERTGLPIMDCKRALEEAAGDAEKAIALLRKKGKEKYVTRVERETSFGRIAVCASVDPAVGAMVELRCESAPVVSNEGFIRLANDLARRLAEGPGAATPDELLAQSSPSNPEQSLRHQLEELFNQVREVFRVVRIARLAGPCGAYVHYNGAVGALLQVEGANAELARDIAMHVAGMAPRVVSRDELDPKCVEKEQQSAIEEARSRGESEKNIPKVVERHLKEFFAQHCLNDQMHVNKERYHGQTVGRLAQAANMKIVRFVRWEVGKE